MWTWKFSHSVQRRRGEEEEADAKQAPIEISRSFDIKVLQTVIEASAHALETVVGKDVVMVAGKTGEVLRYHNYYFYCAVGKFI